MNSIILFIDVDGTLVSYENKLPESAKVGIRAIRKNGHKVILCTGRSKAEMPQALWDIGVDGFIGGNGSYVEYHNQVLFHQTLSKTDCQRIVDWLHLNQCEFYLESNSGLYASEHFYEKAGPVLQQYADRKNPSKKQEIRVDDVFPEMRYGQELIREDVNKISFILNDYQDYLKAKQEFKELQVNTWGGAGETALFGDVGVAQIDKTTSIQLLLDTLNHSKQETIAIGDAKIDIPMLASCGIGIAMGNGGQEIKAMSDYITDAVMEDGLYNAFVHFKLL